MAEITRERLLKEKHLYCEVDGFWVYAPSLRGGFVTADELRQIADILDELNADWRRELEEALGNG